MNRIKKQVSQRQDLLLKANHICDSFSKFTDGIRVMFLIHRAKEGALSANNDKLEKLISSNSKEFEKNLYTLLCKKEDSEDTLRIYSSVNPRNIEKSIRKFKTDQLDNDYADKESHRGFYFDVKNRFISALMSPSSSETSLFIVDIDDQSGFDEMIRVIGNADLNEKVIQKYPTKNGWHIVMNPFNPALLGEHAPKIHKDALLLLDY